MLRSKLKIKNMKRRNWLPLTVLVIAMSLGLSSCYYGVYGPPRRPYRYHRHNHHHGHGYYDNGYNGGGYYRGPEYGPRR